MKFSTKTRYGIRTMMEIAMADQHTGILQKDIATNQDLSVKYLDHIINALKVAGLVTSVRGKKSGYILTKDASRISMYDIHKAFEAGICVIDCMDRNIHCEKEGKCAAREFWADINEQLIACFKSTTLKHMVSRHLKLTNTEV